MQNFGNVRYQSEYYKGDYCNPTLPDDCSTSAANLKYDVYYPDPVSYTNYASCPLPAVILFHAGGFSDCSDYQDPNIITVCQELAKRDFVVFNVEYRRGQLKDPNNISLTTVQQQLAVYRGIQDGRGAIRSIMKRHFEETTGSAFRINVDKIFVGGFSAGGVIAMNVSWYDDAMVNQVFEGGAGSATIQQALGSIDANWYYATKDELNTVYHIPDYKSKIVGNACMWAGIAIPPQYDNTEYQFFKKAYLKPLISFQGKQDKTFFYDDNSVLKPHNQDINFPTAGMYNSTGNHSTSVCVGTNNYYLDQDQSSTSPDLIVGSTLNMRNILLSYGIADEHYVDCDMSHGFTKDDDGTFHGDFGTMVNNQTDASKYLAQRIATFFQAVLNVVPFNPNSLGTNYFPDCENTRFGCTSQTTLCALQNCN